MYVQIYVDNEFRQGEFMERIPSTGEYIKLSHTPRLHFAKIYAVVWGTPTFTAEQSDRNRCVYLYTKTVAAIGD